MSTSLALACRLGAGSPVQSIPRRVRAILRKYGATLLMPGPSGVLQYGFQPGNYRESTGQNLAAVDQQVGLVVDAAGSPGPELSPGVSSTSGWIIYDTPSSFASNGSSLTLVADSAADGFRTDAVLTVGKWYELVSSGSGTGFDWRGTGTSTVYLTGHGRTIFQAVSTSLLMRSSATGSKVFTNISVRELPGIHASQPTSGFQPYLRQSGGVNSWQFDGVDDRLSLSAVPFQMADDHFVVAGAAQSVTSSARPVFANSGTTARVCQLQFFDGVPQAVWVDDAGTNRTPVGASVAPGSSVVLSGVKRGATDKILRQDGVQRQNNTLAVGAATATGAEIGARSAGSQFFSGHIHGVILDKGAISDAELLTLEKFIASLQGRSI